MEKCIVMCTIAAIDSDMGWYYLSCKVCSKKVVEMPNDTLNDEDDETELIFGYYCPKCNYNPKLLPRFYIFIKILISLLYCFSIIYIYSSIFWLYAGTSCIWLCLTILEIQNSSYLTTLLSSCFINLALN